MELVGVVSRRWVWLVVRRYIDILTMIINFPYILHLYFPTPLVLALFLASASLLLCSFLKCFFGLVSVNIYNIKQTLLIEHSKSIQKIEIYLIISIV